MLSNSKNVSKEQLQASSSYLNKHLVIIAAPGSGKTFTISNRIVSILNKGTKPSQILATTFTKKAANELYSRILSQLPKNYLLTGMRFGTIHSCALRIIRAHSSKVGLKWNFKVIDSHVQSKVLESALKDYLEFYELQYLVGSGINPVLQENSRRTSIQLEKLQIPVTDKEFSYISSVICSSKVEKNFKNELNPEFLWLFNHYNDKLRALQSLDFSDILYLSVELFKAHPKVLETYQSEIKYLLVDEFQDTNSIQYEFLMMIGAKANITVCGDDDQAIYSWRGVCNNIFEIFVKDHPDALTLYLHTNFRSSQEILQISENLIGNNPNRKQKEIRSFNENIGCSPEVLITNSQKSEAVKICNLIEFHCKKGVKFSQIAVLFRLNKVISELMQELQARNIPVRSVQKPVHLNSEESAVIAYVKLIINPNDQESFMESCNFPKRKFGDSSKNKLIYIAKHKNCSLFEALKHIISTNKSPLPCFSDFYSVLQDLSSKFSTLSVEQFISYTLKKFNLRSCTELANLAKDFNGEGFQDFISKIEGEDLSNKLNLCTIHSAKGQEWDVVILAGLNEGVLPSNDDTEEERRLAYVAATRARKILIFSSIFSPNSSPPVFPSRFLHEFFPNTQKFSHSIEPPVKQIKHN